MKIIFINRYFYPDVSATSQMLSDLAFGLAECGHSVCVITSRQLYDAPDTQLPRAQTENGVTAVRIWTTRFGRTHLIGRAMDYVTFYFFSAIAIVRIARRGDIVIAKTDPPMLSVIAQPICRMRGANCVNWLQDIFPEVAEVLVGPRGPISRSIFSIMRWLRTRSLRRAAMNVAIGEKMRQRLINMGVSGERIRVVPNWADGSTLAPVKPLENPLRAAWGLTEMFTVGYSGNLGRAHESAMLLAAAARLEAMRNHQLALVPSTDDRDDRTTRSPQISWLFIGGGAMYDRLRRQVADRSLTTVRFESYQPRSALSESLSAADIHIVSLKASLEGLIVPSKFYGVAAVGRPTIFIGDEQGEIAGLIRRHDCGVVVREGDEEKLANAICDLASDPERVRRLGSNALRAFDDEFDKSIGVQKWRTLLEELAQ